MHIRTERLELKEITIKDLPDIHDFHSIPEVDEFNTLGIPENIEVTREVFKSTFADQKSDKRKEIQWTIKVPGNKRLLGLAGMRVSQDRFNFGEIYYKLAPDYWGNGYATEVARGLLNFGFEDLYLHRIEAGVHIDNERSIKVLEKIGMTREGIHREILPIRGKWYDNYHYAILETDERL